MGILVGFDHHGQFHRRRFHLDRRLRVVVKRAVNDLGPLDQFRDRRRVEAEPLFRNRGDEFCAGAIVGIIKFRVAQLLLEMRGVVRRKERALMMVEPPGYARRRLVFEIDDGVLVAGEVLFVEERSGAMHQAHVFELGMLADALAVKAREQRGRAGPVETLVVIEDPYPHKSFLLRWKMIGVAALRWSSASFSSSTREFSRIPRTQNEKYIEMTFWGALCQASCHLATGMSVPVARPRFR